MSARSRSPGSRCGRCGITYVGELGWELHVPIAGLAAVYDALMAAGAGVGIRPVGYRALESLRLEKGYRAWSSDITPSDTPIEAGLGWAVKLGRNTAFLGREALEAAPAAAGQSASPASWSTTRRRCCWGARPSCATASRSAT